MTAATSRLRRRGIGAGVAALVGLTGLGIAAVPAQAAAGFDPSAPASRVAGADRFATAALTAAATFPTGADTVIIANGYRSIDALSANYVAGVEDAPILLTDTSVVPQVTLDAIEDLGATNVVVFGDNVSVSAAARAQLAAAAGIQASAIVSISGDDRFATAAQAYLSETTRSTTVFLARGDYYGPDEVAADALAAGPIAYNGVPVLLTSAATLPESTRAALVTGRVTNVIFLGTGISADVKAAVAAALPTANVSTTIGGVDRSATAAALAASPIARSNGIGVTGVALANGYRVDALAAGPWAATKGFPILLTDATRGLGTGTAEYITANAATLTGSAVFGDVNSVPAALTAAAEAAESGTPVAATINVTPTAAVSLVLPTTDNTTDDRTYSVAGLAADTTYRVTLVNANSIRTAANGSVTFLSSADAASPSGFSVDPGTRTSSITVVNGSAVAANSLTATARPVGGNLSFTVDGGSAETVVPVVYIDGAAGRTPAQGGTSTRLETSATAAGQFAAATEPLGLGGAITYIPLEATSGAIAANSAITSVNKTGAYVISGGATYFFDANDQFRIGAAPVSIADFTAALSTGDTFDAGTYAADAALQSTFVLNDLTPDEIAGTDAVAVDADSLTVTWTAGSPAPTTYNIYRKTGVETATLSDYTLVTSLPGSTSPANYTDNGLTAATQYAYAVTQVVDGDESAIDAGSADAVSTLAAGATAAPESTKIGVTTDSGFTGTATLGDVWQLGFSRAMDAANGGDLVRVQDANGESADMDFSGATLSTEGRTYQSTVFEETTLFNYTVAGTITIVDRDGNSANNNGTLDYPLTVTNASGVTATVNGSAVSWTPAGDADVTLETGVTASVDNLGAALQTADFTEQAGATGNFDTTGDIIALQFDEPVTSPVTGASVTIGGVVINQDAGATFVLSNSDTTLTITRTADALADTVNGIVGQNLTAITGVTGATPAASAVRGLPKPVI